MYANETVKSSKTGYELSLSSEQQALANLSTDDAQDAKLRMIDSYQSLIVSIARRHQNSGVALADLIREGNLGLIYALETLEVKSYSCFLTHATHCISQYMVLAIMNRVHATDSFQAAHVLSFDNPAHERRMM